MTKKHDHVKKLGEKNRELENTVKRVAADFENYKKRNKEMRYELLEFSKAEFLTKISPVLDNFRRALESASRQSADDDFSKGVKQIEKQLIDILNSEGLEKIKIDTNIKFDPNLHEAISCESNLKIPADYIIDEVESGWIYKDKVIKPAKVRVSKGK